MAKATQAGSSPQDLPTPGPAARDPNPWEAALATSREILTRPPPAVTPCRREALQVHLGGLPLEVCSLGRADPALPQAHRHQALPLLGL